MEEEELRLQVVSGVGWEKSMDNRPQQKGQNEMVFLVFGVLSSLLT